MANYTNSPLVEYTHISPYRNSPRNQPITKITWHHTAGVCSLEQFDEIVHRPGRNMSSNYMVDKDARVGLFCPESDRCWCSSSSWNDNRAVVLEISNSKSGGDWPISDKVYQKCIELTVDICKRNGIKKLTFTGDKNGSLTFHRFYAATGCVPTTTTELLTPTGWKSIGDIQVGDTIMTVDPKTLDMKFDTVENLTNKHIDDVYTVRGMSVTKEHRVLCHTSDDMTTIGYQFKSFDELKDKSYRIPVAGYTTNAGIEMTSSEMVFLLRYQWHGTLLDDGTVSFVFVNENQLGYMRTLLTNIGYKFDTERDDLGPVHVYVRDKRANELINKYMVGDTKEFNWEWLTMSPTQFSYFIYKVTCHEDGTWRRIYGSSSKQNRDVVQALCALNERGTKCLDKDGLIYVSDPIRTIEFGKSEIVESKNEEVMCVTVKSGAFLMRQNGYTTITGNCPGEYIYSRAQQICDEVNAKLNPPEPQPTPTPTVEIKAGDLVKIAAGAVYYGTSKKIPQSVYDQNWYVDSVSGTRAVLGKNEKGDMNINSAVDTKYLTVVKEAPKETPKPVEPVQPKQKCPYVTKLAKGSSVYTINGSSAMFASSITVEGMYTIIEEKTIKNGVYGKLKSGAGWVYLRRSEQKISVGDYVKVLKAVTYDGKPFKVYLAKYKVLQVNGDRIVISSDGKKVTAAVKASNLQKL